MLSQKNEVRTLVFVTHCENGRIFRCFYQPCISSTFRIEQKKIVSNFCIYAVSYWNHKWKLKNKIPLQFCIDCILMQKYRTFKIVLKPKSYMLSARKTSTNTFFLQIQITHSMLKKIIQNISYIHYLLKHRQISEAWSLRWKILLIFASCLWNFLLISVLLASKKYIVNILSGK